MDNSRVAALFWIKSWRYKNWITIVLCSGIISWQKQNCQQGYFYRYWFNHLRKRFDINFNNIKMFHMPGISWKSSRCCILLNIFYKKILIIFNINSFEFISSGWTIIYLKDKNGISIRMIWNEYNYYFIEAFCRLLLYTFLSLVYYYDCNVNRTVNWKIIIIW